MVSTLIVQSSLMALLHQIPFVLNLSKKQVIAYSTSEVYAKYGIKVIIYIAIIVGALFIPAKGVIVGILIGSLIGLRAAFDKNNKNSSFVYAVEKIKENEVTNEDAWEIITITVNGVERLQDELRKTMAIEKRNMAHFPLSPDQKSEVLRLTEESNYYFRQVIWCNTQLRDMLLEEDPAKWEVMSERNLDVVEDLTAEMQMRIQNRDVILKESMASDGAVE
ncbi:hypothetical protein EOM60_02365 [Candidatus Saccharibacteria bacterium]|nr:hypothetical protein [Candidatus Saccharibacteria bacterium]